jgi:hypothetical protein
MMFVLAIETSLDVEYAHAIAPGANILLVETTVPETLGVQGFPQIVAAENYVIAHKLGDVITQSFAAPEQGSRALHRFVLCAAPTRTPGRTTSACWRVLAMRVRPARTRSPRRVSRTPTSCIRFHAPAPALRV